VYRRWYTFRLGGTRPPSALKTHKQQQIPLPWETCSSFRVAPGTERIRNACAFGPLLASFDTGSSRRGLRRGSIHDRKKSYRLSSGRSGFCHSVGSTYPFEKSYPVQTSCYSTSPLRLCVQSAMRQSDRAGGTDRLLCRSAGSRAPPKSLGRSCINPGSGS
jgi:hypothetical protein